jgi:predicted transcriptional regulator of viral defense system
MTTCITLGGISATNRQRLAALARAVTGPFTVAEAAAILGLAEPRAGKLLADLAARGWLARVHRNLYTTVPLEAVTPADWRADPWVVAATTFAPCYIGGFSACEHWGLTDQLFRTVVVITTRRVRERHPVIQQTPFRLKVVTPAKLFGTRLIWRGQTRVLVSDPARTLVDLLDDPGLGGGMRQVAEIVDSYFAGELRHDQALLDAIARFGNRAVYKRLGYLVDTLGIDAPAVLTACLARESKGFSLLHPRRPAQGPFLRRWHLRLNAQIT